jgi:5-methylcytosine-specific restriction protein A
MSEWRTQPLPKGWKQLRNTVLKRDRHTCQQCGAVDARHIDHIQPASQGGDDTTDNLQTLCGTCHAKKTASEAGTASAKNKPKTKRDDEPHPGDIATN